MGATLCYMAARVKLDVDAIGLRAQRRREILGLEQPDVAERAGMSRAYISRLENGAVKSPKLGDLASVAQALELSLDTLIYGTAPPSSSDIPAVFSKLPSGTAIAMTNLARGFPWMAEADREFVVGTMEQFAERFGRADESR